MRPLRAGGAHRTACAVALAFVAAAVIAAPVPALSQDEADGRFQIERVGDDVLRLDRETGQVELCAKSTPAFVCRTVVEAAPPPEPGSSAAVPASSEILAENQELRLENAKLKRRLAMIAALVSDAEAGEAAGSSKLIPPNARREIDEALDVTTYAVRRFQDLVKTLTEDPSTN